MCLCEFVIISICAERSEIYRFAGKRNGKCARITEASNHSGLCIVILVSISALRVV